MKLPRRKGAVSIAWSPPVWGAWIEIIWDRALEVFVIVAPRMGGVD